MTHEVEIAIDSNLIQTYFVTISFPKLKWGVFAKCISEDLQCHNLSTILWGNNYSFCAIYIRQFPVANRACISISCAISH